MKKLAELKCGARFTYAGVEWVKLEDNDGGALALAAEPVFERAFDEENCNDWRKSSLRRELNGPFLDALIAEGADRAAFLDLESDLTADDGMTDYGTATDKIALISDGLYRKFRALIPKIGSWWWTLTPWTCDPEYSYVVRGGNSSGALGRNGACLGDYGVRPLCNMKSDILVSVQGEENADDQAERRAAAVEEAAEAVIDTLGEYAVSLWGDVLAAVVSSLFKSKLDAEEIIQEEKAKRAAEG